MAFESFVRPFSNVIETDLGLGMAVLESLAATFAHVLARLVCAVFCVKYS